MPGGGVRPGSPSSVPTTAKGRERLSRLVRRGSETRPEHAQSCVRAGGPGGCSQTASPQQRSYAENRLLAREMPALAHPSLAAYSPQANAPAVDADVGTQSRRAAATRAQESYSSTHALKRIC